jgi:LCP family protein required for cell wall assembly
MDPAEPEGSSAREDTLPAAFPPERLNTSLPDRSRDTSPPGGTSPPRGASRPSGASRPGDTSPPSGTSPPGGRRLSGKTKLAAWAAATLAAVLVLSLLGVYLTYQHLNANLRQVDISGVLGRQPADLHPQAENIVVLGSDSRVGQARRYGSSAIINTARSDTLMIVHIAANRKWADIMSIPRDSWVNIPACRMGNGQLSSPTTFKINEAFTLGSLYGNNTDLGVACTVRTLERDTGIRIDHFVAINFGGFRAMVDAVGGVPECNTTPIDDPLSGLHLTAGHHLLDGWQALGYVRARYTLGNGSDLERIGRQQAFMSSLVNRVKSKLLNPVAIYQFLDAATKSVTIDRQLGGIRGLYSLAAGLKNLPPGKVTFFTLPTYPRYYVDPADTANVMWTQPEDSLIFQAFRNDQPVTRAMLRHQPPSRISPATVTLDVLNGTPVYGLQDTVASTLQQDGFKVLQARQAPTTTLTQTVIRYHAGQQPQASMLAGKVHGAALRQVPGTGQLSLVLGSDFGSTAHTGPGTNPAPASSFAPRTASQNICT